MGDEKRQEVKSDDGVNEPETIEAEELDGEALEGVAGGTGGTEPQQINKLQCYC